MQELSVLTLLAESLRFLKSYFVSIALIVIPVELLVRSVAIAFGAFISWETAQGVLALLGLITFPLIEVAVIFLMASIVVGDKLDTVRCWKLGLRYWWPFFLLSLFVSVVVLVGLLLFIVPGLVALPRLAFAKFYLLFDQQSPVDAMKRSWQSTKSHWGTILMGYLGIFVLLLPLWILAEAFTGIFRVVLDTLVSVVDMLPVIFTFRVYSLVSAPVAGHE